MWPLFPLRLQTVWLSGRAVCGVNIYYYNCSFFVNGERGCPDVFLGGGREGGSHVIHS